MTTRAPRRPSARTSIPALLVAGFGLLGAAAACERAWVDPGVAERPLPAPGDPVDRELAEAGETLYRRSCLACHRLQGEPLVGPNLGDVTRRRSPEWIRAMVLEPDSMLRHDPDARALLDRYRVPMIDTGLDEAHFRAVLEYLRREGGASDGPARRTREEEPRGEEAPDGSLEGERPDEGSPRGEEEARWDGDGQPVAVVFAGVPVVRGPVPRTVRRLHPRTASDRPRGVDTLDLMRLADGTLDAPLPRGWGARAVGDVPLAESAVVEGPQGRRSVHFRADGAAGQFFTALEPPRDAVGAVLSWEWRVDAPVSGARLTEPARDDAPARLFVVFGDGGLFSGPRTLFYSWGGSDPERRIFRSHVGDRLAVIVIRDASDPTGAWLAERREPAEDYERVFGEPPSEPVTVVGFMIDTDQTGEVARAGLSVLRWIEAVESGGGPGAP